MNERRVFAAVLGVSVAVHAGILQLAQFRPSEPFPGEESFVEVYLAQELEREPESVSRPQPETLNPPSNPESPKTWALPEDVALPQALPEVMNNPFNRENADAVFLPREPSLPARRTVPPVSSPISSADVLMEYRDVVRAWMDRYKQYPRLAERRGIEGEPVLRLTISRDGRVVSASMEHSSGSALLDKAALDLVNRAAPFPAFPAHVTEPSLTYLIPVTFALE
jgi:protein TonB